jgi:hypothetical protein
MDTNVERWVISGLKDKRRNDWMNVVVIGRRNVANTVAYDMQNCGYTDVSIELRRNEDLRVGENT